MLRTHNISFNAGVSELAYNRLVKAAIIIILVCTLGMVLLLGKFDFIRIQFIRQC